MMQIAYWILLFCLVTLVAADGTKGMLRSVLAILGCGVTSLALAYGFQWTGDTYTFTMMGVDTVAAIIVLQPPAGGAQAMIGATYLTQIFLHGAKIYNEPLRDMDGYWWGLSIMAFLQLAVIGGWWIYERRYRDRPVPHHSETAAATHRPGDGG